MKIKTLLLLLLLLPLSVSVSAQDGGIKGRTVTRMGREALDGVKITVQPAGLTVYSQSDGSFTIPDLEGGE